MTDQRAGSASPFRHRQFRIYWAGGLCSNSGTWLHNVTASVLILVLTGSPLMVGLLNFANFAPILVLSLVGGVISDRLDRRLVVVSCSTVAMVASALLTVAALADRTSAPLLLAVSFVMGTSYAFSKPALSALLPALVDDDDLANATAINTLQFTIGQVVGSTLSALLLAVGDPGWAFAVNTLTFPVQIAAILLLRPGAGRTGGASGGGLHALVEGLRFVAGPGALLGILAAIVFTNGIVEALRTLAPVLTGGPLGASPDDAGLLVSGSSAGSVLGVLTFRRMSDRTDRATMVRLGFALQAAGAVACALAPSLPVAIAAAVPIGVGFSYLVPILNTTMNERAPEELRGRVMSGFAMAHLGMRPFAALLAGALASVGSSRVALVVFVTSALLGLLTLRGGRGVAELPGITSNA